MNRFKSALLLCAGIAAGIVFFASLVFVGAASAHTMSTQASPYRDVPAKHPAASAVAVMKKTGIITGYADDTYRGSQPVTRYELAVVLARFAKYYDTSKAPIASSSANIPASPAWVQPARMYLAANGFVPARSPLFQSPGSAKVTADLLSDTVSSTMDRLVDRSLPVTAH